MSRLAHSFGRLFDALMLAAALLLLAMVAVVTADIALRNFSGGAIDWANEVSEYVLYLTTILAAPWLLRRGKHVRLDLILNFVPKPVAWRMEIASDILGFVACAVLVRYGAIMTHESWRLGSMTIKNLVFPEWWLLAPLPAIFLLLAAEFIFRLHRLFAGDRRPRKEATSVG